MTFPSITRKFILREAAIGLLVCGSIIGCGKKNDTNANVDTTTAGVSNTPPAAPASITDVVMCKKVTSDFQPDNATSTFQPKDTIRALVEVSNAASSDKVGVTWFFTQTNQQIKHDEATVAHAGSVNTPFMVEKPSGWPVGEYRVDATLNGNMQKSQTFTVGK